MKIITLKNHIFTVPTDGITKKNRIRFKTSFIHPVVRHSVYANAAIITKAKLPSGNHKSNYESPPLALFLNVILLQYFQKHGKMLFRGTYALSV